MATREQTGDGEFYRLILAYDNFANLLRERLNVVSHPEMICGNAVLRKCFEEAPYRDSAWAGAGEGWASR